MPIKLSIDKVPYKNLTGDTKEKAKRLMKQLKKEGLIDAARYLKNDETAIDLSSDNTFYYSEIPQSLALKIAAIWHVLK